MFDFSPTPADLHFRLWGIPVRIHPFFWILALLIGPIHEMPGLGIVAVAVLWVAAAFLGILVHEFGHALIVKHVLEARPSVFLFAMGGATVHRPHECRRDGTWYSILLSAAGPFTGFLSLGAMVFLAFVISFDLPLCLVRWESLPMIPGIPWVSIPVPVIHTPWTALTVFFFFYAYVSVFWGILTLLPIYPLDGGQITREFCLWCSPRRGIVVSLWISVFTAAAIATWRIGVWAQTMDGFPFLAIFFIFFAFQSLQAVFFYSRGYR